MGQSASRSPRQSSQPRCEDTTPDISSSSRHDAQPTSSSTVSQAEAVSERKKSRRRSVFSLPSRSSSNASPDSQVNAESTKRNTMSFRKRWKSSRRSSKILPTPKDSSHEPDIPESMQEQVAIPQSDTQVVAGTSHSSRPSTPFPSSRPTTPHVDSTTHSPSEALSTQERRLSENIGNWLSGSPQSIAGNFEEQATTGARPSHPDSIDIEREINELLSSSPTEITAPVGDSSGRLGSSADTGRTTDTVTPAQVPSRHFPPPGTLVVVQGVVNTPPPANQNATRTSHISAPPPPPPESLLQPTSQRRSLSAPRTSRPNSAVEGNRRSGLSSLMPRPSSMISRPPSSSSRASHRHSEPPPLTEPISAHESTSSSESSESNQSGDADTITPTDSEGGSHALSPGSIDVLGTLLSVAAAATAASLFSPGFSGATPSVGTHPPSTARPLSPTPTAGLGGFGGLNRLAELSMDSSANSARPPAPAPEPQQGDRESRERVRSVWENFRDRLGLGTRGATEDHTGTGSEPSHPENTGDSGAATSPRMRPGEMMLAEMARALNAGLGLAGSAERRSPTDRTALPNAERVASVPPSPQTATAEELTRPLSPDPGFEAFLTNLQADLRTVLSGSHTAASADNNSDEQPSGAGAGPTSHTMSPQHDADVPADVLPFADDMESDFGSINEDTDPPPMSTQQSRHHARTPTPIPPPTTLPRMVASDVEDENPHVGNHRQPAINLWRVYRFPPIPAPPGHALRMSVLPSPEGSQDSSSPSSPADTSATEGSSIGHSAPASSVSPEDSEETPGSAENHDLNVVVPVIVVGLQSVDAAPDRADFEDGPVMPHTHDDGHRHDDLGLDSTDEFGVNHDNASRTGRQADTRGRSWQSRAANALRGFRPGRRNGSRGRRVAESAGSRTFLIYVIGGYYPPNHHVVTGSDSLDSYEALWELADLLGQVKPPVATQEDIEQSGLEIVKAAEMKRHEREGRIASNCTDRCLICLDDYEPENDVRVMSCRHAFHKDCVDKWLQVGRNNCPACRSKGVSTSTDSTTPDSPSSAVPFP